MTDKRRVPLKLPPNTGEERYRELEATIETLYTEEKALVEEMFDWHGIAFAVRHAGAIYLGQWSEMGGEGLDDLEAGKALGFDRISPVTAVHQTLRKAAIVAVARQHSLTFEFQEGTTVGRDDLPDCYYERVWFEGEEEESEEAP